MPPSAITSSPLKYRQPVTRQRSAEPFAPTVPAKPIDLNSSTRSTDRETGQKITRRAFLCDIVVENQGEETGNLLSYLGTPLKPLSILPSPPSTTNGRPTTPSRLSVPPDSDDDETMGKSPGWSGHRSEEMSNRLNNLIEELVRTERSYLSRIHALKTSYADRLRLFSRDPNQQLIPPYEAKAMFANIEAIVPASAAFLTDLDAMMQSGRAEDTVGDVCLKHFKNLRTFDPYRTYLSKQDESQKLFQDSLKKFHGFASFIESTKYQTTGIGNIGLRELLMEPVQRIPRYTLLWQSMIKCMSPISSQHAKLLEAIEIASGIARCDPDPQTVRATVMYHLERNIDNFPAKLFSNSRDYIDAIDVEDLPAEYPTSPPAVHAAATPLNCTLFLFDDKLMIVKRQSGSISGRKVTGTDDIPRLVRGAAIMDKNPIKKDKLSFRGEVDILDVIASDTGNGDFHLFFERPPMDQSGRWSARPFRSYTTVHPPFSTALDPVATRRDKLRFIQNLWAAQALARTKLSSKEGKNLARALMSEHELSLEGAGEPMGRAKCYWDVWEKSAWLAHRKAKVAVHIDEEGLAENLPVGEDAPLLCIRLQPMTGGLCRFSYSTADAVDEDRMVIDISEIMDRVVTTVHKYGIFKFRTGSTSCPTTPSAASHRLRPSMLNLDAISRNLFGVGSVSGRSDVFSTKASRSTGSRSSTMDLSTDNSRKRLSYRSSSPSDGLFKSSNHLIAGAPYEAELGQSELDLNARLDMARNNSRSVVSTPNKLGSKSVAEIRQNRKRHCELPVSLDTTRLYTDNTVRSETPPSTTAPLRIRKTPSPVRALSPTMDTTPRATVSPIPSHILPTLAQSIANDDPIFSSPRQIPSPALPSAPLSPRPIGPRSPVQGSSSNLPSRLPVLVQGTTIGSAHTRLRIVSGGGRRISVGREMVPLKGCEESESTEAQSTPTTLPAAKRQHSADNLTPRKRSPTRSPLHSRDVSDSSKVSISNKPGSRRSSGRYSARRSSGPLTTPRTVSASQNSVTSIATSATVEDIEMKEYQDLETALEGASKKIRDALGSNKRLKSEISGLRKQMTKDTKGKDLVQRLERNTSLPRSPQRRNMNRIVDHDPYDSVSSRHSSSGRQEIDAIVMDECARGITSIVERVDGHLRQAEMGNNQAMNLAKRLLLENDQQSQQIRSLHGQVIRYKEHQDLLQRQLGDAQIELDVIYEAFNTELDGMFNDAQLPETEAFTALQNDLRATKASRNELDLENQKLRCELEEANLQKEQ
ncbi:hypothetical protein I204_06823 [Kwoniella mangroviensis CBS 8886]|nr:hypothetical protein I204_06823 [Kwoniella mangroviensis CBS 8886]